MHVLRLKAYSVTPGCALFPLTALPFSPPVTIILALFRPFVGSSSSVGSRSI